MGKIQGTMVLLICFLHNLAWAFWQSDVFVIWQVLGQLRKWNKGEDEKIERTQDNRSKNGKNGQEQIQQYGWGRRILPLTTYTTQEEWERPFNSWHTLLDALRKAKRMRDYLGKLHLDNSLHKNTQKANKTF